MNDPDRLQARPPPGLHALPLGGQRDSYLFVPGSYNPARPAPLVPHDGLRMLYLADSAGLIRVGRHGMPPDVAREAVDWLMAGKPAEEG